MKRRKISKKAQKIRQKMKRLFKYHGLIYFDDGQILTAAELNQNTLALLRKLK